MKDGLTQVKELKDKIHEQYMEIQELNKARKFDIEYNKYLQKEIIRLNNIINELEKFLDEEYEFAETKVFPGAMAGMAMGQINRIKNKLQELKGSSNNG